MQLIHLSLQRAMSLQQQGQWAQAQALCEQVLVQQPDCFDALHLLGALAYQMNDGLRALEWFDRAIAVNPQHAQVWANQGAVLRYLRRYEQALTSLDRALALDAHDALIHNERGVVLRHLGQPQQALASFERAIEQEPNAAQPHWNRSRCLLQLGDFARGWPEYEWRWKLGSAHDRPRSLPVPLWLGAESLRGKTVLLHSEQGLGDTLQFCRYARWVNDLGAKVVLEVPPSLYELLGSLEGVAMVLSQGQALPQVDYHCPLLSLPLALATRLETIPKATRYLRSDPAKVAHWRTRLGACTQPRVGLVWSGSARHSNDANRSMALAEFAALLPPGYSYVSLQKELTQAERVVLQSRSDILDVGQELTDFNETAALCDLMDVVLSVDTSVAHLAGALGKPVWVLLALNADWRWLLERQDSPWYPSARLYRQESRGDWAGVWARVAADLVRQNWAIGATVKR